MTDKAYSLTGDEFSDFESTIDSIDEGETVELFVGDVSPKTHDNYVSRHAIRAFIDNMIDYAYGDVGDFASNYLEDVSDNHVLELKELILEYFNKNIGQPNFYSVYNINKEQYTKE